VPGSKSLAIRAIVAASLAPGVSRIRIGEGAGDDVAAVAAAVERLGVGVVDVPGPREPVIGVHGAPGYPARDVRLDLGECGTGARLLLAAARLAAGPVTVDGAPGLRARPMGPLVAALRARGATVEAGGEPDRLPLTVRGGPEPAGGRVEVDASVTSQVVSAMLLTGVAGGIEVATTGRAVSRPYVDLTVAVMGAFGVTVERRGEDVLAVPRAAYVPCEYVVEADASAAAFWLAAAAIAGGEVLVRGIPPDSLQPDRAVVDHLVAMGCDAAAGPDGLVARGRAARAADLDVRDSPDLVPALAAVAATVPGRTRLVGAPHLVHKESDRIASTAAMLGALGVRATPRPDGLEVEGGGLRGGVVDPRGDHRIAMAAAILGRAVPGVVVRDPGCAAKSDPGFLAVLGRLPGEPA
jgi:3-phosphoshikimate 1-carboxyvinyltransferase